MKKIIIITMFLILAAALSSYADDRLLPCPERTESLLIELPNGDRVFKIIGQGSLGSGNKFRKAPDRLVTEDECRELLEKEKRRLIRKYNN